MSLIEHLLKIANLGSEWILYGLLLLSILSLTVMAERAFFFWKNARGAAGLRDALRDALLREGGEAVEGALARHPSAEADVLRAAWSFRQGGPEALLDAVESELATARRRLDFGMTFLGTVGNNAPFVGLLGTVIGVIQAFAQLGGGDDAAMGQVMALIAEALIATGVGIFVAIPAVAAYNVAQARVSTIEGEAAALGRLLAAWLRTPQTPEG